MARVADKNYDALLAAHLADYQALFGRVKLNLRPDRSRRFTNR